MKCRPTAQRKVSSHPQYNGEFARVITELEHVTRFADREVWNALDDSALGDLRTHVAGLPSEREAEHITAKLFDLVCLNLHKRATAGYAGKHTPVPPSPQ